MKQLSLALFAILALPISIAAQTVHILDQAAGPGSDFTTFKDAIDAAGPGDIIVVRSGTYASPLAGVDDILDILEPITLTAEKDASVLLRQRLSIQTSDPADTVVVAGIEIAPVSQHFCGVILQTCAPPDFAVSVSGSGTVLFDRCSLRPAERGAPGGDVVRAVAAGPVIFSRCEIAKTSVLDWNPCQSVVILPLGLNNGIYADASEIYVHDSTVAGYEGASDSACGAQGNLRFRRGGDGIHLLNGATAFVSGSAVAGGPGGDGGHAPPPLFCGPPGAGGHGVLAELGSSVTLRDTDLVGGVAGVASGPFSVFAGCVVTPGPDGSPSEIDGTSTLATESGTERRLLAASPLRAGELATLIAFGLPEEHSALVFSASLDAVPNPLFGGFLHLADPVFALSKGVQPLTGVRRIQIVAPDPGAVGLSIYLQAVFNGPAEGFVLSNPVAVVVLPAGTP